MNKNNTKNENLLVTIGNIIYYILLFPFILIFGIVFVAIASIVVCIYAVVLLVSWPFRALFQKKTYDNKMVVPEKIEPMNIMKGDDENEKN